MPRKLAAGNWKMNGLMTSVSEVTALAEACPTPACDVLICPPATAISALAEAAKGTPVAIGAQDCHANTSGAHTGDLSAEILVDAGASYIIVGHSERRADHGESNETVRAKAEAAWRAGAIAIICVGETEAERDAGEALTVVGDQLAGSVPQGATAANTVIAYEPVWAIGTGQTATPDQAQAVHATIRSKLAQGGDTMAGQLRILYGGSVKGSNAQELFSMADIDGGLIGGASLSAEDFLPICHAG